MMKAKTVHNLALTFILACGAGVTTVCAAEGIAMAHGFMGKPDSAAHAVASLGMALGGASIAPAMGFGFLADAKKKSQEDQKGSPSPASF